MTTDTASQAMISTLKAYEMGVDDAEDIVDRYNEVANNFAIDTAQISTAIEKSGASLKAAGNDLNESLGMIVAANDALQDPASVGQMLKTNIVLIYSNVNLRTYLIAGNALEPYTTIAGKLRYDGLTT